MKNSANVGCSFEKCMYFFLFNIFNEIIISLIISDMSVIMRM